MPKWLDLIRDINHLCKNSQRGIKYYRQLYRCTPSWADYLCMKAIYMEAKLRKMEVDHIVPLNSPIVCGLHWEGNLQLLDPIENRYKSNHTWQDHPIQQLDLFDTTI